MKLQKEIEKSHFSRLLWGNIRSSFSIAAFLSLAVCQCSRVTDSGTFHAAVRNDQLYFRHRERGYIIGVVYFKAVTSPVTQFHSNVKLTVFLLLFERKTIHNFNLVTTTTMQESFEASIRDYDTIDLSG